MTLKVKQNIPNFLTCCNLLCGCLAIVCAFEGSLVWAAYLVGIAAVFDFFDGFVARLLGVSSPIGKDLDSLADMVTFGVVPGIVMYKMIQVSGEITSGTALLSLEIIAFIIPIFSAIRLAKFNNDTRQSESFIGLPTPANAIFITSFPLIGRFYIELKGSAYDDQSINILFNPAFLVVLTFILSFLLVANLPLFALKFKSFGWKGNEIRYVFLALSLVLLIGLQFLGIPLIIILYVVLSIINNLFLKPKSPATKS